MSKNKFNRYVLYALGEIVLVVIGILIAIQINGWNEERKNRSKERALLAELHKESKENLKQFEENKQAYLQSLNACRVVLRNVDTMEEKASLDSIMRYGPGMFRGITFDPSNGVVASLLSTGEIQLIRNDSLRNYIITWRDVLKDFKEEEDNSRTLWKNQVEPFIITHGDFTDPSNPKNIALCKDLRFLNMIARRRFYITTILNAMEEESIEQNLKEMVRLSGVQ
ncbi:DUF6090 family protein [Aureisphaera galaxeae]|uniref:DUF6090 family protein n=1 Tax=Aureisphaera galaxeae TaxID=1538023 RepID=UPI002350877F|nr:DUF6090 family protein [Aureisphaera galaxeae]MDC8003507.1 DUF6090 family protein [Aureisphaera galaxeae]